jgi:hypothetical protein
MLDLGRYLLGVGEIFLLVGAAWLGATSARQRLTPNLTGAPAHLATSVLALTLLIWSAELLGAFGLWDPVPYLALVTVMGIGTWTLLSRVASGVGSLPGEAGRHARRQDPRAGVPFVPTLIALAIASLAAVHFALGVKTRLSTGMTGFDSTWYHGPFAAGFFQSGDTWGLHFIASQFLAWFYPANSELFHAIGMGAFGRDLLSPLLNLGWFGGCLAACWCIGRPYRVAPWSLALGAIALSVPALSDQAGEARNDIVGIFFLLAAVAVALNAWAASREGGSSGDGADPRPPALPSGALVVVGLAAGLAAGTKLNFLLPAGVLVCGLAAIAPRGRRLRALSAVGLAALAGGGYWYLRNLIHTGNPLPWIHHLGPISLPSPGQTLGGREAHSALGYLGDGSIWSDWFLPGLHSGLWIAWPLLGLGALMGLVLALRRREPVLLLAGLVGLATALAWLVAPTSASGPEGMPRGFESGLRYLAPALVLGLALVPVALRHRLRFANPGHPPNGRILKAPSQLARRLSERGVPRVGAIALVLLIAVAVGYPAQRHYLQSRYADPSFTTPGLNAAFAWSRDVSGASIATTSTRQYPLFGTDLSNRVQFLGTETAPGGFQAPPNCRAWRQALNAGGYDYVVASRDRIEPGKPPFPPQARWTEGPGAELILKKPPTAIYKLKGPLSPSGCPAEHAPRAGGVGDGLPGG